MNKNTKIFLNVMGSMLLTVLSIAFLTQFFCRQSFPFHTFVQIFATLLVIVAWAVCVWCYFCNHPTIYKFILIGLFLVFLLFLLLFIYEVSGLKKIIYSVDSLRDVIKSAGIWAPLLFVVIQFLQVVILPIPSTITVLAGVLCFGPWISALYSFLGIMAGSLVGFWIGRVIGYRAVVWLIGKETVDKWLQKTKGKDALFLSGMFLLPMFPDDVLCFIAGLSSMSFWMFLLIIAISRALSIFVTSFSIHIIPFDTWWGILLWVLLFAAVIVGLVFLYKNADKIQRKIKKIFHRKRSK